MRFDTCFEHFLHGSVFRNNVVSTITECRNEKSQRFLSNCWLRILSFRFLKLTSEIARGNGQLSDLVGHDKVSAENQFRKILLKLKSCKNYGRRQEQHWKSVLRMWDRVARQCPRRPLPGLSDEGRIQ